MVSTNPDWPTTQSLWRGREAPGRCPRSLPFPPAELVKSAGMFGDTLDLPLDDEEWLLARLVDQALREMGGDAPGTKYFDKKGRAITCGQWYALRHEPLYYGIAY